MPLFIGGLAVLLGSGAAALLLARWPRVSAGLGTAGAVVGLAFGLYVSVQALLGAPLGELTFPWDVPFGRIALGMDPLSAAVAVPLFGLGALTSLAAPRPGNRAALFNTLVTSMAVVVSARNGMLFLVAWEVMTLSSYLLVTEEHREAEVRRAGWIYLVAAHIGVSCLLALFLLIDQQSGSLAFHSFGVLKGLSPDLSALLFALAVVGFGVKAGLVGLHVWLPEAHAAAPSHVSALMSGALIKLGVYGILRALSWLAPAAWWAPVMIALGLLGGLLGISLALSQRDLKRVLAYSSVENVGLIFIGVGVGYWGYSRADGTLAALGFGGALFHLWNHAAIKGLLFLGAGQVVHATHTRDLERLGGLLKLMPWTGTAMILGGGAIAALPPLNALVSEWLLYMGLIHGGLEKTDLGGLLALIAVGGLALIGALTLLAFTRALGIALLGQPRSEPARGAHEGSVVQRAPLVLLVALCILLAVFPRRALSLLSGAIGQLASTGASPNFEGLSGVDALGGLNAALWVLLIALGGWLFLRTRRTAARAETWGCGYAAGGPRIQYTARSFSELFAEHLLPRPLRARNRLLRPAALFPQSSSFSSEVDDPFTRGVYEPFFARWAGRFSRLRWLQQGVLPVYLLYILVVVVVGLGWLTARSWLLP